MVKQGYKQTEIGVIPVSWEVKELGELGVIGSSKRIFESDYVDYGVPFYRGKEISLLMENKSIDEPYYISEEKFASLLSKYGAPQKNDLLITAVGTLGNIYHVNDNRKFYFKDGNLIWIRKIEGNSKFIKIALDYHKNQILENAIGSSQKALTIKSLSITQIPLPPLAEQEAIATALSDADAWIENLEQLIAKKRLIKQGAMQELLTPPSTSSGNADGEALEPWEVKKLGEVFNIIKGQQFNSVLLEDDGDYPCYSGGISPSGYSEKYNETENTIIISEGGNSCGYVNFVKTKFWLGGHCYKVVFRTSKLEKQFTYHLLKFNQDKIMSLRVGSGLPNIQKKSIEDFEISFPSLSEQTRIATILSDMDAELEALEQKLSKARQIKQGMMQELLTGRIRLV